MQNHRWEDWGFQKGRKGQKKRQPQPTNTQYSLAHSGNGIQVIQREYLDCVKYLPSTSSGREYRTPRLNVRQWMESGIRRRCFCLSGKSQIRYGPGNKYLSNCLARRGVCIGACPDFVLTNAKTALTPSPIQPLPFQVVKPLDSLATSLSQCLVLPIQRQNALKKAGNSIYRLLSNQLLPALLLLVRQLQQYY